MVLQSWQHYVFSSFSHAALSGFYNAAPALLEVLNASNNILILCKAHSRLRKYNQRANVGEQHVNKNVYSEISNNKNWCWNCEIIKDSSICIWITIHITHYLNGINLHNDMKFKSIRNTGRNDINIMVTFRFCISLNVIVLSIGGLHRTSDAS